MSRRICVVIERGMTDKTAKWVFPWERAILELIHGGNVEEKTIDELCKVKEGVVKVEKVKQKHSKVAPPSLREQYELQAYVDPENDPVNDPVGEYERLANLYGMDKDLPIACVTRVYGEFSSGAFTAALKEHAGDNAPRPKVLDSNDEHAGVDPSQLSREDLRKELSERGIKWLATDSRAALQEKLEAALEPA